ncbi:class I lanthipeptide [Aquimarina algiphila]|uniref:class I lanthipeptide n=1 Tax=Aquimarina algiphila TaxID=2047982 RepID=UPI00232E8284|nr:class I lanthipeptide [Aquimarina algiphila]
MKKLHLKKITVSKLSKEQFKNIIGGSNECDQTRDLLDPKCDTQVGTEDLIVN